MQSQESQINSLQLPAHLKKYIVTQDYEKYTAQDHALWRYILRQLKSFLSHHAHHSYLDGLKKTGIEIDRIPRISDISQALEKFGWRALPVSGFIPPAAFMELQALSVLPIASDMRSMAHLLYTPAPDIVHEAAGHAPIIADPEYAAYLKQYAQVARKAIISGEDLNLYSAIRELSDLKENPHSTATQISSSESKLAEVARSMTFVSEAAQLSRMNWWTAEYGLIGQLENPKIFGAGLLSSVGESRRCLSSAVRKIPLSLACIEQSYDITEPQPQLYVARDFSHLSEVLEQFSATMAYRTGGVAALKKIQQAATVNTIEFENGLQISGILSAFICTDSDQPAYLQFQGPSQLSLNSKQIDNHSCTYHSQGYGTPLGPIEDFSVGQLQINKKYQLKYKYGVVVSGTLIKIDRLTSDAVILSFTDARAHYGDKILFQPDWGTYDIILAEKVTTAYGGPADREQYGEVEDFAAQRVQPPLHSEEHKMRFRLYQLTRQLRRSPAPEKEINDVLRLCLTQAPADWLLYVELLELSIGSHPQLAEKILSHLDVIKAENSNLAEVIDEGTRLAHEKS